MSPRYFCAHCDKAFVPEDAKNRCPTCMRKGVVLNESDRTSTSRSSRRSLTILAVLALLAGLAFTVYRSQTPSLEATPPLRPLTDAELAAYLDREGVEVGDYRGMFALPSNVDGVPDGVDAAAAALRSRTRSWSLEQTLPRSVLTADATLAKLTSEGERERVYPLETATALAALLRQRGVTTMVADAGEFEGERAPSDPSGLLGYYVVALYENGSDEPTRYVDPWGGRADASPEPVRVLSDVEVVAAALGIEAVRTFSSSGDAKAALPMVETALLLDPRSPTLRVTHAVILSESGGLPQALQELDAALQLRADAPRKLNQVQLTLAQGAMMQAAGEPEGAGAAFAEANRLLTGILDQWPRYGRAHLTLATMYLGMNQPDRARVELETVEQLGVDSPMLAAVWAQYHVANGQPTEAAARINRAIALDPDNWQLRAQAAGVFQGIGDNDRAREQAETTLRLVPESRGKQLRAYFEEIGIFGGTPVAPPGPGSLELPEPSVGRAPGDAADGEGPALMLGDPSNLRLRDPGQTLELDLDDATAD
jgi:thioredoxin-like negative regulator of GroEL